MVKIELTDSEISTLRFYLDKALIDARGMAAISVGDGSSIRNLESITKKIGGKHGK